MNKYILIARWNSQFCIQHEIYIFLQKLDAATICLTDDMEESFKNDVDLMSADELGLDVYLIDELQVVHVFNACALK